MFEEILLHGAVLSALMSCVIFGSLWHDPRIWTHALPPDAQALAGAVPLATVRRRRVWIVPMVLGLGAVFVHLAWRVGGAGFVSTFVAAFFAFQLYNLFDAVVIDLGLLLLQPRFAVIPGTERAPGLRDPRWHLKNFGKGVMLGAVIALLVASLDAAVRSLA